MAAIRRIVIVGAGLAGLRAGEALRDNGFDGELTVVGDEQHPPYNRPPLSKQLLAGSMTPDQCWFPTEQLGASWRLGSRAVALDRAGQTVRLEDGTEIGYDGLVIASGCRARPWPTPVPAGVHTLRTLDDSRRLRAVVGADTRVAVVGAGFLGCEVAATFRAGGVRNVALIDTASHPMPALGALVGQRVARIHAEHGVDLHLGTTVRRFTGGSRVRALELTDGTTVPADVVVLALGSVPNTEWLAGSGIPLHRGRVLCDAHCAVLGTDRIVAAGDVAAWAHPHVDEPVAVEHWTNAGEMAGAAADALLAVPTRRVPFAPIPTFWTHQYHLRIQVAGMFSRATHHSVADEDEGSGKLVVEGHRDGQLVGAVTVNRPRTHIDYRRALEAMRYADVEQRLQEDQHAALA